MYFMCFSQHQQQLHFVSSEFFVRLLSRYFALHAISISNINIKIFTPNPSHRKERERENEECRQENVTDAQTMKASKENTMEKYTRKQRKKGV